MLGFSVASPFFHLAGHTSSVVRGNELGRLHLAQQLVGVAPDVVVVNFGDFDPPLGVHDERTAIGHTLVLDHHAEAPA